LGFGPRGLGGPPLGRFPGVPGGLKKGGPKICRGFETRGLSLYFEHFWGEKGGGEGPNQSSSLGVPPQGGEEGGEKTLFSTEFPPGEDFLPGRRKSKLCGGRGCKNKKKWSGPPVWGGRRPTSGGEGQHLFKKDTARGGGIFKTQVK